MLLTMMMALGSLRNSVPMVLFSVCLFLCLYHTHAADTLRPTKHIGFDKHPKGWFSRKSINFVRQNDTLVSEKGVFELGFFGENKKYYMGIWIKNDKSKKVVWVANRNKPFPNASGTLHIGRDDGNLMLSDCVETPTLINKATPATTWNTSAKLLDSGNLVFSDEGGRVLWQSFDYPTDTFLPGMKIGWYKLVSDTRPTMRNLVSWANPKDPSPGYYHLGISNSSSYKSLSVWQGNNVSINIGFWNGETGFQFFFQNLTNSFNFSYVSNENESYFTFDIKFGFLPSWFVMTSTGQIEEYYVVDGVVGYDTHILCNQSTSSINITSSQSCLSLKAPSKCKVDKFSEINGTIPLSSLATRSVVEFDNCGIMCKNNCSCSAFSFFFEGQTVCLFYFGHIAPLLDVIEKGGTRLIYIRGDLPINHGKRRGKRTTIIDSSGFVALVFLLLSIAAFSRQCKIRKCEGNQNDKVSIYRWIRILLDFTSNSSAREVASSAGEFASSTRLVANARKQELHEHKYHKWFFSLSTIESATNSFTTEIGEGGFGHVYKGQLPEGQEIAVKRLSRVSTQGVEEFKNEVIMISKIQHKNMVKLLGCCIEGEETMLIYEYMANGSLDKLLFDSKRREALDWRKRVKIIHGIVDGVLYLHRNLNSKIIHRDLKTSNILLDAEWNPMISDFGMAITIGEDDAQAKTQRIVGTVGYVSPEYAMDGNFSDKSDVFSFGIILLEILSGRRNIALCPIQNLPLSAWNLWKEGKGMEFMDPTLSISCSSSIEVDKYIRLAFWCLNKEAANRPTMFDIFKLLNSIDTTTIPIPEQPYCFN
ncbi:hypothetical protein FNV43_RR03736 [Rhamnella rubrinervis]|uniref:Receptor-like serine/threonine-protein kinase n=1 Tax=Rhamnella rubrinervis TaxID=2594499 RepID=A0A8K0HIY4_9ROSA|nr:hypothetical protein FNV43_RR03736 [Rhamnella rubrinervis]